MKKCYATYKMVYVIEVPEEDLNDLHYDEDEDGLLWKDKYDPEKVIDYFNDIIVNWNNYYDVSIESVDIANETVYF